MKFFKRNWAYFLVILIFLIFLIQLIFYYATFYNSNFGWDLFSGLLDKDWSQDLQNNYIDDGLEAKWGAFGDYIGGILNPILGFITIILLLLSHDKDKKRDEEYHSQREIDLLLSRLENLKINQNNYIQNIRVIKKAENREFEDYITLGNLFFSIIYNVINAVYKEIRHLQISDEDKLRISYLVVYHGKNNYSRNIDNNLISDDLKEKIISKIEGSLEKRYGLILLSGFKTQLSSYFRNIYHIMGVIENSKILTSKRKYEYSKDLRVQMSPQEQIVLLLNTLTETGAKWDAKGYCIIFKLFRNVNTDEYFEGVDLKEIVYHKIDNYNSLNPSKLSHYFLKDRDINEFKKNYFEFV